MCDAPQSVLHDAPDTHWHARPASLSSTVGRGNARSRRTVKTVISLIVDHILEQYFYALNALHIWTIALGYIGLHT